MPHIESTDSRDIHVKFGGEWYYKVDWARFYYEDNELSWRLDGHTYHATIDRGLVCVHCPEQPEKGTETSDA